MFKDIVIIGGGPAGNAAALAAADCGATSVLLVERDAMGGTCTNRGCIPTKFLLARSAGISRGAASSEIAGEWARLLGHKNGLVRGLARSIEARCVGRGIEVVKGTARFTGPSAIQVVCTDGSLLDVEGARFIVATGSGPLSLPQAPADGRLVLTSTDALELREIPESLAVIGSGAVGSEFCQIFTRLGVKVTLIEAADRLFPQEDEQVDQVFRQVYARLGVRVITGAPVFAVEAGGSGVTVSLTGGEPVNAAAALVGIGRTLGSQGLGCEAAGIALGPRGEIVVDERLRTSQPHILAAGDVTGRMLLAHAAAFMGEQAGLQACGREGRVVPYGSIPWATFTEPEVAGVGMTLAAAERAGFDARSASVPLMESVKARIDRTTDGFIKVVVERGSGRLLGGTIVGPHASDLIHIIALAVHQGMTVSDMRGFSFVHPSISELIGDLYSSMK